MKAGDKVRLKSGGPEMVVRRVVSGVCSVEWPSDDKDGDGDHYGTIKISSLELIDEPKLEDFVGTDGKEDIGDRFYTKSISNDELEECIKVITRFGDFVNLLKDDLPDGRYKSLVLTHLEIAAMFSSKSITHEG